MDVRCRMWDVGCKRWMGTRRRGYREEREMLARFYKRHKGDTVRGYLYFLSESLVRMYLTSVGIKMDMTDE